MGIEASVHKGGYVWRWEAFRGKDGDISGFY